MRITFVVITSSYSHSSLALPYLHRACEQAGIKADWTVLRATVNDDPAAVALDVIKQSPDVVLGTMYLFNHEFTLKVCRRVAEVLPSVKIILGGPEFLGENAAFLKREPSVAAVIRGEGERALPQLLACLDVSESWHEIDGVCARTRSSESRAALTEAELQALGFPYDDSFFDWSKPFIQIETNRGCPHHCTFCTSCDTGRLRSFRPEQVRGGLAEAQRRGVREIRVLDRTFNATPKSALAMLAIFQDYDLHYHLEFHPAFISDDLLAVLADAPAGRFHIEVGLQTTHPKALRACRRAGSPEQNWEGLRQLAELPNIALHVDLLGGLPHLPLPDLKTDLLRLIQLGVEEIQLEILKILPGTPIADLALTHAPDPPYEILATDAMTVTDLAEVRDLSILVDRFHNHPMLRPALVAGVDTDENLLWVLFEALNQRSDFAQPMSLEKRAQFLHDMLTGSARARLELDWVRYGLSPKKSLAPMDRCREVPTDAELAEGTTDFNQRQAQVWSMEQADKRYFIVYDRAKQRARPVAIYIG